MRGRGLLLCAIFLLLLRPSRQQPPDPPAATCNMGGAGNFPPQPNPEMPMCCWYRNSTCCNGKSSLFGVVKSAMENFANRIGSGQCLAAVANFLCMYCNPLFGTYLSELGPNHFKLSVCSSFCDSLYSTCTGVSWGDLLPDKPANSADLCKVLFETQVQTENNGVMYSVDIVDSLPCFGGANPNDVWCSGCLEGSPCAPPAFPSAKPRRPPPPSTPLITVGIAIVAVFVCVGAVAAFRYFARAVKESNNRLSRRGRDYYPSTGEGDNEALNG